MTEDKKPLTRSPQLIPLSHEHYDGLLFVWRIRQGLRRGTPSEIINDFIKWFWNDHLQSHFNSEEKILMSYLAADDDLGKRMMQEHEAIRKLIAADNNLTSAQISSLATLLHDHIRYEERDLFPHIEKKLSPDDLNEVARKLEPTRSCSTEWTNEFWKS